jgi:hypothetical protein
MIYSYLIRLKKDAKLIFHQRASLGMLLKINGKLLIWIGWPGCHNFG